MTIMEKLECNLNVNLVLLDSLENRLQYAKDQLL